MIRSLTAGTRVSFDPTGRGEEEGEVVHRAGARSVVVRRAHGLAELFVLVNLNGWRILARLAPHDLEEAIERAVGIASGRRA